jgi:signal transduction histidine kinase
MLLSGLDAYWQFIDLGQRFDNSRLLEDTGIGIPAEHLPRVFERFHRVPNARSRTHEGTGIGLALARRIIELHDGRLWVESEGPGLGSTFCFTLGAKNPADNDNATKGETT